MEVFQKLVLNTNSKKEIESILKYIEENADIKDWKIKRDFISNYKKNMLNKDVEVLCLASPKINLDNKFIEGYVWFGEWKENLEVFNIVPTNVGSLTYKEYNTILNEFYKDFIVPLNKISDIDIIKSSDTKTIEDIAGVEVANALKKFSLSANKSTGNSHPMDAERWNYFVCLSFKEGTKLSADDLARWLEEEDNWSNDLAWELSVEYEKSIDLLNYYNENF